MTRRSASLRCTLFLLLMTTFYGAAGQDNTGDSSTVTYPASYFTEYSPVTAQDMLDRIPGATSGGRGSGGGFGRGGPPGGFSRGGGGRGGRGGRGQAGPPVVPIFKLMVPTPLSTRVIGV